jgi:Protein of unknown function (DUF4232)
MKRTVMIVGVAAVLGVAGLAGCGTGSTGSPGAEAGTSPSVAPPSSAAPASPAGSAGQSAGPGGGSAVVACTTGHLAVSIGGRDAGSGHRSRVLAFRNTGTTTCLLRGYPTVAAVDTTGEEVARARRTPAGYLGGIRSGTAPVVRLAPGEIASATVEALAFGPDGASCTGYHALLVTPPGATVPVRLAWGSDGCSALEVHPVVAGTSGRSG